MLRISRRESVLLFTLFLVVTGFGVNKLVYEPKMADIAALRAEAERTNKERADVKLKTDEIPKLQNLIKAELLAAQGGAPLFFNSIPQENLIVFLTDQANDVPVSVVGYSFSELTAEAVAAIDKSGAYREFDLNQMVDEYKVEYGMAEAETAAEAGDITEEGRASSEAGLSDRLGRASVTLSFESTYEELLRYLEGIEQYEKGVFVNSLTVDAGTGGRMTVSIGLDLYRAPKIFPHPSDYEFEEWRFNSPRGKNNPFNVSSFASAPLEGGAADEGGDQISFRNPDFFLAARPVYSGLPSMTIGYSPDSTGETYLRSYKDGLEIVTVYLTQEDGKYFYSFSADGTGTYPDIGREQFIPINNDIRFVIFSNGRESADDTNEIALEIINETGLPLNWKSFGEDPDAPRVAVNVIN